MIPVNGTSKILTLIVTILAIIGSVMGGYWKVNERAEAMFATKESVIIKFDNLEKRLERIEEKQDEMLKALRGF